MTAIPASWRRNPRRWHLRSAARVNELTGGRVAVGPGTLYNLLEQFLAAGYIVETRAEGRRRSYQLTAEGETLLQNEVERLQAQVRDYEKLFER